MKKLLLILLIASTFTACKKTSTCYSCDVINIAHTNFTTVDYCGPDGANHQFYDSSGHAVNSICTPK